MADTVTASAVATGDLAAVTREEATVGALFGSGKSGLGADPALAQALEAVVATPSIGAFAAVELARVSSGWTASLGPGNGLAKYETFARTLAGDGWFVQQKVPANRALPPFDVADPVASVRAIFSVAYPEFAPADQVRICAALIRSLGYALGPDGVPVEEVAVDSGTLAKTEVLERRITTLASNVLAIDAQPTFHMNWKTEVFERTKDGKDEPKSRTTHSVSNHRLVFNLERWRTGDRSTLLGYYRYAEEWLKDFNTTANRTRSMACFDAILRA